MNILVTALSLYNNSKCEKYSFTKDGFACQVTGNHTNEPVPKALQLYLREKGQQLDEIILLCTPATLCPDETGKNSFDKFTEAVTESGIHSTFHIITLNELADSQSIYNASIELLQLCRTYKEPALYIDSTGGFRDAMMFLISMMQLLKEENFSIEDVFYTVYDRNTTEIHPILSRMDAYRVYDLISGYDELNTYGDPRKLINYFSSKATDDYANKILEALNLVYQEMQLCRVAQSNCALLNLSCVLEEYTPNGSAFDRVVELAQKKYGGIKDGFTYQDYIKWYFNHGYIPQTLAFFYEMLPDMLVSNRILYPGEKLTLDLQQSHTSQVSSRNETYTFINTYFKETYHPFKIKVSNARNEVLTLAENSADINELSENGKKLYEGIECIMLGKLDPKILKRPAADKVLSVLKSENIRDIACAADLWKNKGTDKIYNRIAANQKLLCAFYNIDQEEINMSDRTHAELIVSCADNKDIFIKEDVNPDALTDLLENYFYLKKQRNSILHVGQDSASLDTLIKNIENAITLMDEVIK